MGMLDEEFLLGYRFSNSPAPAFPALREGMPSRFQPDYVEAFEGSYGLSRR